MAETDVEIKHDEFGDVSKVGWVKMGLERDKLCPILRSKGVVVDEISLSVSREGKVTIRH